MTEKDPNYHDAMKCGNCGTIVMSLNRHDCVPCECYSNDPPLGIFIDGGFDYLRAGSSSPYEVLKIKIK